MSDGMDRAGRESLHSELAELRGRLAELSAPPFEATALPAALRARRAAAAEASASARPEPAAAGAAPVGRASGVARVSLRRRAPLAAAATLAVAAVAALLAMRHDELAPARDLDARELGASAATAAVPGPDAAAASFQPLLYSSGLSPSSSYSVVRVRIPLSALAQGPRFEGTIEADLLVGEDGIASGIRFASTDTLVVSAVSPCCGERR